MYMLSLCALLYGFNDYALELAKPGWADRSEIARMTDLIQAAAAQSNEQAAQAPGFSSFLGVLQRPRDQVL